MNTKALAVAASLWVPMVASAATEASVTDRQEALSAQLEEILAKNGIAIGGSFRGEVGSSLLDGNYAQAGRRDDESIGYTSVDFDLRARPNTTTTARAVFRMHLDHASFFSSPYAPLETRWLSLDGGFADMAYYHLGNLQAKWSPLVIGATEPGFLYTPRIFAQQQKQAEAERFVGGGVRNLQGANLGLRAAVPNLKIDSFDVSALAAKLLTAAGVGSPASINTAKGNMGGDGLQFNIDSMANFDRWSFGGKANVAFLNGFKIGGNYLKTMDLRSTYGSYAISRMTRTHFISQDSVKAGVITPGTHKAMDSTKWSLYAPDVPSNELVRDSMLQNGNVVSGVFGANVGSFLGSANLIAELNLDVARSSWDFMSGRDLYLDGTRSDSTGKTPTYTGLRTRFVLDTGIFKPVYSAKTGAAINIGLVGGWKTDAFSVKAKLGYLSNDSSFRSDLAQTPVFFATLGRIFNTEQDMVGSGGPTRYNTFDALYHSVHRYVAEDRNEYDKSPYDKIAYSNYVAGAVSPALGQWTLAVGASADARRLADSINGAAKLAFAVSKAAYAATKSTADSTKLDADSTAWDATNLAAKTAKGALYLTSLNGLVWDRDVQLVLPGGEASANRVGPKFGLDFDLMQGGLEVKVDGYMLEEVKGSILDSADQVAAGKAKFQQIQAGAKVRADKFIKGWNLPIELSGSVGISSAKGGASLDYASTAINAGLYVGVIKRVSVLGGFQKITGKDKAFTVDRNQSNLAGGLEFKVQEGAYLTGMYNLIKTEFPNATEFNFDQSLWSTKISVTF